MKSTANGEEEAFRTYRRSGTHDSLVRLLELHLHRIFNLCWQVLRHREDAEDAAQETLIDAARNAANLPDATSFRRWIHRVSICTALDLARKRTRRAQLASRAAMEMKQIPPLDDEDRRSLFEAISRLSEEERSLLIEHHFEGVKLENLAAREGCSATAIWKRIERARETLKRTLAGAGFTVAAGRVAEALESATPVQAPAGLVGGQVLAALGGIAVGTSKTIVSAGTVLALLLVLFFGLGVGLLIGNGGDGDKARVRELEDRMNQLSKQLDAARSAAVAGAPGGQESAQVPTDPVSGGSENAVVKPNELLTRLKGWKAWFDQGRKEGWALGKADPSEEGWHESRRMQKRIHEGRKLLQDARNLIYSDPNTFLEFLRDSENEQCLGMLISHALDVATYVDGYVSIGRQSYAGFPEELTTGFLDMLRSGTAPQKTLLLGLMAQVDNQPKEFIEQYRVLLADRDPNVQACAVRTIGCASKITAEIFESIRVLSESSQNLEMRRTAIQTLASSDLPVTESWLLNRMETNQDRQLVGVLASGISRRLVWPGLGSDPAAAGRYARALTTAGALRPEAGDFFALAGAALRLPGDWAQSVLTDILPYAPTPTMKEAVSGVLAMIRRGGVTQEAIWAELNSLAFPKTPSK